MSSIHIIHALDKTTEFLSVFRDHFCDNCFVIEPNAESVKKSITFLEQVPEESLIVFLGHGHSTGLYTPEVNGFEKYTFIDKSNAAELFENKLVILLSCRSSEFIDKINSANQIIGFGNILSSPEELRIEADLETGRYRDLSKGDLNYFNYSYCYAIINALNNYKKGSYIFKQLPTLVEFYINQKINETLLNKAIHNRVEIARLLFEFRNEMLYKKSPKA